MTPIRHTKTTVMLSCFSRVWFFVTLWSAAPQAPLSMGCSRQENWSGLPFPSQGDLPDPGIKPTSSAVAGGFFNLLSHQRSPSDSLQNTKCQLSGPALKKGLPAPIYMLEYTVGWKEKKKLKADGLQARCWSKTEQIELDKTYIDTFLEVFCHLSRNVQNDFS